MARIESYIQPATLYRYRKLSGPGKFEKEIGAIAQASLFCPTFDKLNDPMEGIYTATPAFRESDEHYQLRQEIRDNKLGIGLCSFSEVNDNELMWAHYGDEFRGMCIAYDFSHLLVNLSQNVSFVRMSYSEEEPKASNTRDAVDVLARRSLSSKSYKWLYEREWRMFGEQGLNSYDDPRCVTVVYLGYRVSGRHRDKVRDAMSDLKIPVHKMSLKKYSIAFEELATTTADLSDI